MDVASRYVALALMLDRLRPGLVDAYTGDPHVRAGVLAQPAPDPGDLLRRAAGLRAELPHADLTPARSAYLDGQLAGLQMTARVLDGQPVGLTDRAQAFFQVTPTAGDPDDYARAHAALDDVLPGHGPLVQRYAAYRHATALPVGLLPAAVRQWSALLQDAARNAVALPATEHVTYRVVTGHPWAGFNYYHGLFRSTVSVNADLPVGCGSLPALIAHESYPGHHTDRCRKQQLMTGCPEHQVWLVNTPENLVAEGAADLALAGAGIAPGWGAVATDLYAGLGIAYDGDLGEAVAAAAAPLGRVRQDAALLLHDRHRPVEEAVAHLRRWGLASPARVDKTLAFLSDPLWSAYVCTYVEGADLVRDWLAARPGDQPVTARFARLLDEPLTPAMLRRDLSTGDGELPGSGARRSPARWRTATLRRRSST